MKAWRFRTAACKNYIPQQTKTSKIKKQKNKNRKR